MTTPISLESPYCYAMIGGVAYNQVYKAKLTLSRTLPDILELQIIDPTLLITFPVNTPITFTLGYIGSAPWTAFTGLIDKIPERAVDVLTIKARDLSIRLDAPITYTGISQSPNNVLQAISTASGLAQSVLQPIPGVIFRQFVFNANKARDAFGNVERRIQDGYEIDTSDYAHFMDGNTLKWGSFVGVGNNGAYSFPVLDNVLLNDVTGDILPGYKMYTLPLLTHSQTLFLRDRFVRSERLEITVANSTFTTKLFYRELVV